MTLLPLPVQDPLGCYSGGDDHRMAGHGSAGSPHLDRRDIEYSIEKRPETNVSHFGYEELIDSDQRLKNPKRYVEGTADVRVEKTRNVLQWAKTATPGSVLLHSEFKISRSL